MMGDKEHSTVHHHTTTTTAKLLDKHYLPITVAGMRAVTVSLLGTNPFT